MGQGGINGMGVRDMGYRIWGWDVGGGIWDIG